MCVWYFHFHFIFIASPTIILTIHLCAHIYLIFISIFFPLSSSTLLLWACYTFTTSWHAMVWQMLISKYAKYVFVTVFSFLAQAQNAQSNNWRFRWQSVYNKKRANKTSDKCLIDFLQMIVRRKWWRRMRK